MPYDIRTKDGIVVRGIPDDVKPDDPSLKARVEKARADKRMESGSWVTDEMSGTDKFFAGAGKAASDLGLGIRQLVGKASQAEVDEVKQRDAALMDSGAGMAGNIAGNVAMSVVPGLGAAGAGKAAGAPLLQAGGKALLASPATVGGALTQGGMGAVQAGLQPVATGESRGANTMIGGAAGAAVPIAGMGLKAGHAAIEPFYEGGKNAIVGRTMRRVAGNQADDAMRSLQGAGELIPGSAPTAGQAANNAGIAALERTASAIDPTVTNEYTRRMGLQNEARVRALQGISGTTGTRAAADTARENAAGPLYRKAMQEGADPEMSQVLQPQIQNLMERMPSGVLDKAKELARVNGDVLDSQGSVQGLHYVKLAVDDLLSGANQTGIGAQTQRGLMKFKDDLLTVVDDLSPTYGKARETFASMSKPINQMDVGAEIADKSINKLTGKVQPGAYARALSDDTAASATGFNKSTLANTMEPGQLAMLNALKDDLVRANFAETAGRGVGSDSIQKLAYSNFIDAAGVPTFLRNMGASQAVGNIAGRGADVLYGRANKELGTRLAEILLDPKKAGDAMNSALPNANLQKLADVLRMSLTPAAIGTAPAMLDARQ